MGAMKNFYLELKEHFDQPHEGWSVGWERCVCGHENSEHSGGHCWSGWDADAEEACDCGDGCGRGCDCDSFLADACPVCDELGQERTSLPECRCDWHIEGDIFRLPDDDPEPPF